MATSSTEGQSQGPLVSAIAQAFGVVTFFVLVLRLFSRGYVTKRIGVDDILITFACLFSWAFIVATVLAVKQGLGDHYDTFTLPRLSRYLEIVYFSAIFYNATLGFIKTSVLALYMRLGDPWLRRFAIILIVVVSLQALGNCCAAAFQCNPISAVWDLSITEKTCININAFYLANAALNIFTDLLTYTLPIRLVFHLQLPRKQKMILGVMLCLGLFACLSSIIRIVYVPILLTSADATYVIAPAMYWSVIETNVGILAASIPSFKPVAQRYLPVLIGEYSSSRKGYQNSGDVLSKGGINNNNTFGASGHGSQITSNHNHHVSRNRTGFTKFGTQSDEIPLHSVGSSDEDKYYHRTTEGGVDGAMTPPLQQPPEGKIMTSTHITMKVEDRV